ncbi:MAG: hypothetical protein JW834_04875, partial [Candidatus Diapherotrites archaeon]|nr:hypothetical protein [Candidatus Diapherotrites archaeon]
KDAPPMKRVDVDVFGNVREFMRSRERLKAYLLQVGTCMWFGVLYIYIPLYIVINGLPWELIGWFLFAVCLPLVLMEYWVARMAEKHGFRRFMAMGFVLMALASFSAFVVNAPYPVVILLAAGSIGVAFVESLNEAYFFRANTEKGIQRFYGIFHTSTEAGFAVGKLIAAAVLFFTSFQFIFLALAVEMLLFAGLALTVRKR